MMQIARTSRIGIYEPSSGPSGPSRYIESILAAIDPEEFQVTLFCRTGGPYAPRPGVALEEVMPQIRPRSTQPATRAPFKRSWRAAVTPAWLKLWSGFGQETLRLAAGFRRRPVDLLHTNNAGCEESAVAARLAGVPRVLGTFHIDSRVDVSHQRDGLRYRTLEFVSNQCLHAAIAVSDATGREWIRRTRIAPRRVVTIRNGINPGNRSAASDQTAARQKLGLPTGDALIVGGVGRLDAVKGFDILLSAAASLAAEYPNLYIALAGDGPLRQTLEAQAARLGIANRVRFLGFRQNVSDVYQALDIFAMPSRCEALPYALLEAMTNQLPSVASNVGGIPEVIVHGETGLLTSVDDHHALATALKQLLDNPPLRQQMGRAARHRVIHHFSEREMVARTIDLYRRLLNGARTTTTRIAA
jgi:glycosyltransferase involved in cell wall biosynthesis